MIFSILSIILFLHSHVLFGASDMQFHMKRAMEWYQSIEYGHILPTFSFNYFHGSAVMSMYPYFSMLPFIILIRFVSSFVLDYYIFFAFIIFTSLLISYFSSLRYSHSILISYIFSVVYSMSSLFIFKMFTDGDLGVVTSLIFLPLVIFGFLDVLNGSKNYLKMALGIALMCYCQIAAISIIVPFLVLWILINITYIHKRELKEFVKAIILSVCLTIFVWLPFFKISVTNNINTVANTRLMSTNLKFFVKNLSIFPIIAIIFTLIIFNKLKYFDKQMYILSLLVIFVSSKLFPWHLIINLPIIRLLNQFQFTYRFLIIPEILLSYIFSLDAYRLITHFNKSKVLFVSLIILIIISQILVQGSIIHRKLHANNMYISSFRNVKDYELNTHPNEYNGCIFNNNKSMKYFINGYITNKDYYPRSANKVSKYIHNDKGIYNYNHLININHDGYNQFSFRNYKKLNKLALPLLHYNNEHLYVYLNNRLVHYSTNKNSLITLNNVNNGKNKVKVQYVPNMLLVILKSVLFLIGLLWLIIVLIENHINKRINY